jgi:hypothetical protein
LEPPLSPGRFTLGVHHAVSHKYLQTYVDEYTFRYNHRKDDAPMFQTILGQVQKAHVFGG